MKTKTKMMLLVCSVMVGTAFFSCKKEEVKPVDNHQGHDHAETRTETIIYSASDGEYVTNGFADTLMDAYADNPINSAKSFKILSSKLDALMSIAGSAGIHGEFARDLNGVDFVHVASSDQYGEHGVLDTVDLVNFFDDNNRWMEVAGRDTSSTGFFIGKTILEYHTNAADTVEFHFAELESGGTSVVIQSVGDSIVSISAPCSHGLITTCPFHFKRYNVSCACCGVTSSISSSGGCCEAMMDGDCDYFIRHYYTN